MIACGVAMIGAMILAGFLFYTKRLENARWLLNILVLLLPLPFIANTFGWIITEAGRQPWMVVGLQKVSDAVSQNITSTEVFNYIGRFYTYLCFISCSCYLYSS